MSMEGPSKRSSLVCVAGALIALAGAAVVSNYAKSGKEPEESQATSDQIREGVGSVFGNDNDTASSDNKDHPPLAPIKIKDIIRSQARKGVFEAAALLIGYYDARTDALLNPPEGQREQIDTDVIHQDLLEELEISEEEYKLFRKAIEFRDRLALIDNNDGEFDDLVQRAEESEAVMMGEEQDKATIISSVQLQHLLIVLCEQAASPGGAFDPQFLSLIGKNPQELKDFAQQIYAYYASAGAQEQEAWKDHLAYLRYHYGLAATEDTP